MANQFLRRLDDDFLVGGPLSRGLRMAVAVLAASVLGGVVGLFAAVPLTAVTHPAASDYGAVVLPFGTTVVGAVLGGLGMAALYMRRRKPRSRGGHPAFPQGPTAGA
ncbi:MAG: hypothetical protein QOE99_3510 [Actinomycetota bacterium]|nr:hypothetical protein [Actinomycetota bacterium]